MLHKFTNIKMGDLVAKAFRCLHEVLGNFMYINLYT
jgi:hypothetical protein